MAYQFRQQAPVGVIDFQKAAPMLAPDQPDYSSLPSAGGIARRRRMARQLMEAEAPPVYDWASGLTAFGRPFVGGIYGAMADAEEQERTAAENQAIADMLRGGQTADYLTAPGRAGEMAQALLLDERSRKVGIADELEKQLQLTSVMKDRQSALDKASRESEKERLSDPFFVEREEKQRAREEEKEERAWLRKLYLADYSAGRADERQARADSKAAARLERDAVLKKELAQINRQYAGGKASQYARLAASLPQGSEEQRRMMKNATIAQMDKDTRKEFIELNRAIPKMRSLKTNVDRLITMVKDEGSELFNVGAFGVGDYDASKMASIYDEIFEGVQDLRPLGVLQQGDIEFLKEQVPDPTSWGAFFTSTEKLVQKLEGLKRRADTHLQTKAETFQGMGGDLGLVDNLGGALAQGGISGISLDSTPGTGSYGEGAQMGRAYMERKMRAPSVGVVAQPGIAASAINERLAAGGVPQAMHMSVANTPGAGGLEAAMDAESAERERKKLEARMLMDREF